MIDNLSPPGSYARFFAQRDGTPFEPMTEEALSQLDRGQTPDDGGHKARVRDRDIIHAQPTIPGAE